jgi:hypothetical protein
MVNKCYNETVAQQYLFNKSVPILNSECRSIENF